ncbi:MAG: LiaF transmembrane domain-containing protein [Erysipelotrichaceae bacterium]
MKSNRIFWGSFFVLGGVALLLSSFGYLGEVNLFSLIFSIFLVAVLLKSLWRLNITGVVFTITSLLLLYQGPLGLPELSTWSMLLAATLGSIGLSLLFHRSIARINAKRKVKTFRFEHDFNGFQEEETIEIDDANRVTLSTNFGSSIKYVNSTAFEQANLDCSFGSMKVYFDNAVMLKDQAIVQVSASFGGVELYFPKEWHVENRMSTSFGGVEEHKRRGVDTTHTIILTGDCSFAGIEIYYV